MVFPSTFENHHDSVQCENDRNVPQSGDQLYGLDLAHIGIRCRG